MIAEQIKKDMVQAMKDKDAVTRDILRVLRGELQRNFVTEDGEVIRTIKKMIANLKENNGDEEEISILEDYLPQQMSESEMRTKVKAFINENNLDTIAGMGMVMSHFKDKYAGTYDGKALSTIVKAELS